MSKISDAAKIFLLASTTALSSAANADENPDDISKTGVEIPIIKVSEKCYELDRFLVVVDGLDRLVGGACFEVESEKAVYLDGIVIARQLQGGGLGSALLEDFCMRMSNYGFEVVRTHFYRRNFYLKRSFQTDKRWGGLVRFLVNPTDETREHSTGI